MNKYGFCWETLSASIFSLVEVMETPTPWIQAKLYSEETQNQNCRCCFLPSQEHFIQARWPSAAILGYQAKCRTLREQVLTSWTGRWNLKHNRAAEEPNAPLPPAVLKRLHYCRGQGWESTVSARLLRTNDHSKTGPLTGNWELSSKAGTSKTEVFDSFLVFKEYWFQLQKLS